MRSICIIILSFCLFFASFGEVHAQADPFSDLKQSFEEEKDALFVSFAASVDGVLAEEYLTDERVVNELVNEHLLVFAADIEDLKKRYEVAVTNGEYSDYSFWDKYTRFSIEILMRRVQAALFLAIGADAEMEKLRTLIPAIEVINYQMDYSRQRLEAARKSLVHFDAHFACYCSSCNTR